jgi:hypothetical protein
VTVKPGDTLWAIANKYLRDPARWDEILKHNRLPTNDPTVALPGMTLKVPVRLIKAQLRAAHLVYAVNRVLFRRKETPDWRPGRQDMELFQGDSLRTLEDSKARVKLLDKELLSLEPNSMAVIKPANIGGDLELKSGSIFAGRARVVTANASITPKTSDTRYSASVAADLTTRVEVFKGRAAVDAQGSTVEVPAGMATRVMPGLAPELPRKIENMPALESRAFEYASALKVGGGAAPEPRGPAAAPPEPEADAESLRGDIQSLRVGVPILGYRVQAARDREFREVIFDRKFDSDERFQPDREGIRPGAYWWRVALTDLLGTEGRFGEPRYYSVGIKRAAAASFDFRKAVTITAPAEDSTTDSDKTTVVGVIRDDRLRVVVDGRPARADEDGNFVAVVPLRVGTNEILIVVSDPRGNQTSLSRRVTRLRLEPGG